MQRLRCGVILLDGFIDHLAELAVSRAGGDGTLVSSLEYIRCVEGEQAGEEWTNLGSINRTNLSSECVFDVDGVTLYMSRQTQRGLRDKWVDCREGAVVVG
ncbi:MAG: hypothetical protein GY899_00565 [Verrucomicrobiaceae bacterium]|nr:hypothetical protein [Verrucomicrobiaceae bacterium]